MRYVIAALGRWPGRRHVLLDVQALGEPDWASQAWPVRMHRRQVDAQPTPERDKPVSRQRRLEIGRSRWLASWWSGADAVGEASLIPWPRRRRGRILRDWNSDPSLRSFKELTGYAVRAVDDIAGYLHDLIVDDERWTVEELVITVGRWLPRRRVLVSSNRANAVSAEDAEIRIGIPEEVLLASPVYRPGAPVNLTPDRDRFDYHGRPTHGDTL
jgi:hypothetical protein